MTIHFLKSIIVRHFLEKKVKSSRESVIFLRKFLTLGRILEALQASGAIPITHSLCRDVAQAYANGKGIRTYNPKSKKKEDFKCSNNFLFRFVAMAGARALSSRQLEESRIVSIRYAAEDVVTLGNLLAAVKTLNGGKLEQAMICNLDEKPLYRKKGRKDIRIVFPNASANKLKRRIAEFSEAANKSFTAVFTIFGNGEMLTPHYVFSAGAETVSGKHPVLEAKASQAQHQSHYKWTWQVTAKGSITAKSWLEFVKEVLIPGIAATRVRNGHEPHMWYVVCIDGAGTIHTHVNEVLKLCKEVRFCFNLKALDPLSTLLELHCCLQIFGPL